MNRVVAFLFQKRFATLCAALLVPVTGVWFTYWERDQSHRESVRAQLEAESEKHKTFIEKVSNRLVDGDFKYLDAYARIDRMSFKKVIEQEAKRLNQPVPNLNGLISDSDTDPPWDLPDKTLSEIYGAKLNLLLESLRGVEPLAAKQGTATKLARETLHFLRRTGLLDFGGLFNTEADLSGLNLSDVNLPCSSFYELKIKDTNFENANLAAAYISSSVDFHGVNFSGSTLWSAWLAQGRFHRSKFEAANLQRASLKEVTLQDSSFDRADLREAYLYGARLLEGNSFRHADMRGAVLLFDRSKSAAGRLFDGAFANSRPFRLDNGRIIPATVIPPGYTYDDLGLIDVTGADAALIANAGTRDGEEGERLFIPDHCNWKVAGNHALMSVYRGVADYVPK